MNEFEKWKEWFDSHKEPDGTIILSKHPDLVKYLNERYLAPYNRFKDFPTHFDFGGTVNFELKKNGH